MIVFSATAYSLIHSIKSVFPKQGFSEPRALWNIVMSSARNRGINANTFTVTRKIPNIPRNYLKSFVQCWGNLHVPPTVFFFFLPGNAVIGVPRDMKNYIRASSMGERLGNTGRGAGILLGY